MLNNAGAVDWTTWSINADKLNFVRGIILQHGQGLSDAQIATISERFN
jgi:hypothetical protein